MKAPLFEFPSYQYEVDDWEFKKKGLFKRINKSEFYRTPLQEFDTDRIQNGKRYIHYLQEFLMPELNEFCQEAKVTCAMTDAWCTKYQKGDHETIHNHRGWGFSGVLYAAFDPKVHTPTCFVAPWQNPRSDTTHLTFPQNVKEGTLLIIPSFVHHFVHPNRARKERITLSFDLLPNLPLHHSVNNEKNIDINN